MIASCWSGVLGPNVKTIVWNLGLGVGRIGNCRGQDEYEVEWLRLLVRIAGDYGNVLETLHLEFRVKYWGNSGLYRLYVGWVESDER
jgi:hypothetical protein